MTSRTAVLSDKIDRIAELVRAEYVPDSPTHDLSHLARVASLCSRICSAEGGSHLVALSAAWLHDLHREAPAENGPFFVSPEHMDHRAERILSRAAIPKGIHSEILEAIHYTDRFTFSDRPTYKTSIEAKIVRDADCLDATGAIGVARSFSFGGSHGIPLWRESVFTRDSVYKQSERPTSTIQHFYDKLLRLAGELETPTAKELGYRRSSYLSSFVDEFMREWREDLDSSDATGSWLEVGLG